MTLGDGLFTASDLRDVNTECLYEITAPKTPQALRDDRTRIDLLTPMDVTELRNATNEYTLLHHDLICNLFFMILLYSISRKGLALS